MGTAMRRIHVGNALSAFGLGFTTPYLYVYTAQVRGLGAQTAGLVLALLAVAALVVLPFIGRAIVARGAKPVLIASAVVATVGTLGMLSPGTTGLLTAVALLGAGTAAMQPALATLIVDCSTAANRSSAFALQFFVQNLGLGIGGLIGGHLVDETRPGSFTLLYLVQAAMFLVLVAVTATLRVPRTAKATAKSAANAETATHADRAEGGWRQLLGNRAMVSLLVLGFVLFLACYGQFESGLSAYGVEAAGVSTSTLGTGLAANTLMIVLAQFVVLKSTERRRRSRVIAAVGLVWTVAWAAAGYAGLGGAGQSTATAAFISTYVLFGLGEAMLSPTLAPLVADLAPTGLAGQYNSAFALAKQLALALGPAIGGPMAASLHGPYIAMMLALCLGVTALALRLEVRLTPAQNQPLAARSRVVARGGGSEIPEAAEI